MAMECPQEFVSRIDLSHRLTQPSRRYLDRDPGAGDTGSERLVQLGQDLGLGPTSVDLGEIGVRHDVHVAALGELGHGCDVPAPHVLDRELLPDSGALVDGDIEHLVNRSQKEVPRIRCDELRQLVLVIAHVVDLEPELDGQPEPLGLHDDTDICVEVERATLE